MENQEVIKLREKIVEMIEGIENPATLKFIFSVIENYLKSRGF